jgi:hypothetical protein
MKKWCEPGVEASSARTPRSAPTDGTVNNIDDLVVKPKDSARLLTAGSLDATQSG